MRKRHKQDVKYALRRNGVLVGIYPTKKEAIEEKKKMVKDVMKEVRVDKLKAKKLGRIMY
jgi:hypothetical protein